MQLMGKTHLVNQKKLAKIIAHQGFFFSKLTSDSISKMREDIVETATQLGTPNKGRNGQVIEELIPKNQQDARTNSLSKSFGLDTLPFHIDAAHYPIPSRYLVFACSLAVGEVAPTFLLDRSKIVTTNDEESALQNGVFMVRNGRNSFYANVKPSGCKYLRWDPGCMIAKDKHAALAARVLSRWPKQEDCEVINWSSGALLVVDNWQMLHARGAALPEHGERSLLRITVL